MSEVKLTNVVRDHPFDDGYWARYFNKPDRPNAHWEWRAGWDTCDRELAEEAAGRLALEKEGGE